MPLIRHGLAALSSTVVLGLGAGAAFAHIAMTGPMVRYPAENPVDNEQKDGPCGRIDGLRTLDRVCTFKPGAVITLTWDETIEHVGDFRISFDIDGDDDFIDPIDNTPEPTELLNVTGRNVQADGNPFYSQQVTLPDVECDNCTLRLLQVMKAAPPYAEPDMYYQCADIVLSNDAPDVPDPGCGAAEGGDNGGDPDAGGGGGGGGGAGNDAGVDPGEDTVSGAQGACSVSANAGGTAGLLLVLGMFVAVIRRRR